MKTNSQPRAAIYIRCARHEQFATEEQRKECLQYIAQKGYKFTKEYIDMSASGIRHSRRAFDAMTIDAHIGEIDKIIVISMSRISRSAKHATLFCQELQESCGVTVESVEGSVLQ